ncbi:glucose-6-phosphate dehydrogenase [soil metagenome]
MNSERKPALEPAILVIFGITGDLSKRYLLPSIYHLVKNDMLHEQTEIIGVTRGSMTLDDLLSHIELCVSEVDGICDPAAVNKLKSRLQLRHMDVTDGKEYVKLLDDLNSIEDSHGVHMNRLYYLSIPPKFAAPIITFMGEYGLNGSCHHGEAESRLLLEKPFGYDFSSAKALVNETDKQFREEQVFRIDHYLAKETVQNILAFRFNNPIFEPLWNSKNIDYIEVLANEKLGIEGRVNFYEQTGALRDLIQSHLLQILALITMEQPDKLTSELIHKDKLTLMKQMLAIPEGKIEQDVIRGQYEGYKTEVDNPSTTTETFTALRLFIDSKRWNKVPMIVKTGKALVEKLSEVNVVFKPTDESPHHNVLTFRIQPNEGIELSLRVKKPGFEDEIQPVEMNFDYKTAFAKDFTPTAYERVLVDAVRGDRTLFATAGEIMESWRVLQPIIDNWTNNTDGIITYEQRSAGPDVSALYPDKI